MNKTLSTIIELLKKEYNTHLFYNIYADAGQKITINNVDKNIIIELCLKYLINIGYDKLIYNKIFENGVRFKLEKRYGGAIYFDIGIYQEGEKNIQLVMQYSEQFFPKPRRDSIMYLDLTKSIYRRLKREMPSSTIEQLSKYPRFSENSRCGYARG